MKRCPWARPAGPAALEADEAVCASGRLTPGRATLWLLVALVFLLVPLRAQEGAVRFTPAAHLEHYEEAQWSDDRDLYDFTPFEQRKGKLLGPAELTAVREEWQRERRRVAAALARLATEPADRFDRGMKRRLQRHPFFSKIEYEEDRSEPPYVLYVQLRPKREAQRPEGQSREQKHEASDVAMVRRRYVPMLRRLEKIFVDEYCKPLGLHRRADTPCFAIAVLASAGDYHNFASATGTPSLHATRAHYEPDLRLAVTYDDPFAQRSVEAEENRALLHEFVHELQHAYSVCGTMPRPVWFNEGLAEYLAIRAARAGDDAPAPDAVQLDTVVKLLADQRRRSLVHPLTDLLAVDGYSDVFHKVGERGVPIDGNEIAELALRAFYAESTMLVHYMHQGEEGRLGAAFHAYFGAVMRGEHGLAPFASALQGQGIASLQESFGSWLSARWSEQHRTPLQTALVWPKPSPASALAAEPGAAPAAPASGAPARAPARAFTTAGLDLPATPSREHLAAATAMVAEGRYEAALALLKAAGDAAVAPATGGEDLHTRLRTEQERIGAVLELRHTVLTKAIEKDRSLTFGAGAAQLKGCPRKVTGESIVVRPGKGPMVQVPLIACDAAFLYREGERIDAFRSRSWLGAYLLLVAGGDDKRIARHLTDAAPEASALRAERAEYAELRTSGAAALSLRELAHTAAPADAAAATALLDRLSTLLREHGSMAIVRERRASLRALAGFLLERTFDARSPACLGLHAAVASLPNERVKLTWSFDDEGQAHDLQRADDYMQKLARGGMAQLARALGTITVQKSGFAWQEDHVEGIGSVCCRLPLGIRAPFTVRWSIAWHGDGLLLVAAADDAAGNFIGSLTNGTMFVFDEPSHIASTVNSSQQVLIIGRHYDLELRHDGKGHVESWFAGAKVGESSQIGTRDSGGLVLCLHSNMSVELDDLEIEGTLDPAWLTARREQWIAAELARLFGG